jgi:hypothetical protein
MGPQMPSVMEVSTTNEDFDFDAFLAEIPEEDWSEALKFFVVTANRCWQCKAPDHYSRDCPQRLGGTQSSNGFRGSSGNQHHSNSHREMATFVGSLYTQQGRPQNPCRHQAAPRLNSRRRPREWPIFTAHGTNGLLQPNTSNLRKGGHWRN